MFRYLFVVVFFLLQLNAVQSLEAAFEEGLLSICCKNQCL